MSVLPVLPVLVILLPFAAAALLPALPSPRLASRAGLGLALADFALTGLLPAFPSGGDPLLLVDPASALLAITVGMLGVLAAGLIEPSRRVDRAAVPALLGTTLLATLAGGPGLSWVALQLAAVAVALATALPRTDRARHAARRALVRCGGGLALMLFGVVALALAVPSGAGWGALLRGAGASGGAALSLATACLLVGAAVLAGLVPLQGWLIRAQAVSPPVALLSGALGNAALLALLRLQAVAEAGRLRGSDAVAPGPPILAFGLLSVLVAAIGLWRARDAGRLIALSGVAGRGLAACAIGLGATEAALLQMAFSALTQAAAVLCLERRAAPGLAGAGLLALAGLPPFPLFVPQFLILTAAARQAPLLCIPLGLGLLGGSWALLRRGSAPDPAGGAIPGPRQGRSPWNPFGLRQGGVGRSPSA